MCCKKVFLEISQNLQENTGARVSFLICRPQACNIIKKETLLQVFSCKFCETPKNTFFTEHLWWLLLAFIDINILTHFSQVFFIIETGHLICSANELTGLYLKCKTRLEWVKDASLQQHMLHQKLFYKEIS